MSKDKKRMTGLRLAGEIRQYKKDALLSPMFTILCVILEILIPYKTAAIIDEGIAVGDMKRVAVIGSGPAGLAAALHLAPARPPGSGSERASTIGGRRRGGIPGHDVAHQVLLARAVLAQHHG